MTSTAGPGVPVTVPTMSDSLALAYNAGPGRTAAGLSAQLASTQARTSITCRVTPADAGARAPAASASHGAPTLTRSQAAAARRSRLT